MDSLTGFFPGALTAQQMLVLEARSALLAPPAADLPSTPAPDEATQKDLLNRAFEYAATTYTQLPHLTATKTTVRFQDGIERPIAAAQAKPSDLPWIDPNLAGDQFIEYIGSTSTLAESQNGVEILSGLKDRTRWGENGEIALLGQGPVLNAIVQEAQASGKLRWLRWEMVNGRQTAVFSFAVEKKRSHYAVNYCCFPEVKQPGWIGSTQNLYNGGDPGTTRVISSWSSFKETVPYHGELFVDSNNGIIIRLVTEADFKSSEYVHQERTRIDYGPVTLAGKALILPLRTIVNTEVIPGGKHYSGKDFTRRTLFTSEYRNYMLADAATRK
jgi:hypothetical protein